jgi:hypothetical protein
VLSGKFRGRARGNLWNGEYVDAIDTQDGGGISGTSFFRNGALCGKDSWRKNQNVFIDDQFEWVRHTYQSIQYTRDVTFS